MPELFTPIDIENAPPYIQTPTKKHTQNEIDKLILIADLQNLQIGQNTDFTLQIFQILFSNQNTDGLCFRYNFRNHGTRQNYIHVFDTVNEVTNYLIENTTDLSTLEKLHLADSILMTGGEIPTSSLPNKISYNVISFGLISGLISSKTVTTLNTVDPVIFKSTDETKSITGIDLHGNSNIILGNKNIQKGILAHQLAYNQYQLNPRPWIVIDITSYTTGLQSFRETHSSSIKNIKNFLTEQPEKMPAIPFIGKENFGATKHMQEIFKTLETVDREFIISATGVLQSEQDPHPIKNDNVTLFHSVTEPAKPITNYDTQIILEGGSNSWFSENLTQHINKLNTETNITIDEQPFTIGSNIPKQTGCNGIFKNGNNYYIGHYTPSILDIMAIQENPKVRLNTDILKQFVSNGGPF